MNTQLAQSATEGSLSGADELLRQELSEAGIGIWELSLEAGVHITLSPELQMILGIAPSKGKYQPVDLLRRLGAADRRKVLRAFIEAVRSRKNLEVEFRFCPAGKSIGWLLARGGARWDPEGRVVKFIGMGIDITLQKQVQHNLLRVNCELERRLAEGARQLQATNKELETLCYSISHDLRAPLRSIRGFNEVLLQRYAMNLDDRGREFLQRASNSSHHMDELIEELLKLSRVARAELRPQTVNLSDLAKAIAAGLHKSDPARVVKFEIQPDLAASGDEPLLRMALEHLIGNAWKFTSPRAEALIEFGCTAGPERAFFVRDNGAGFDASNAGRLFGAFQRLHSDREFGGNGIGLATVQRIINRHAGRVWAEGAEDQGATFYFILPPMKADEDL
jgi:signal transduction histidine kinase